MSKLILFLMMIGSLHSDELWREYYAPIAPSEKENVAYIINTMGMGSLAKIALARSSLKKAGKRIDHLHPLNFLLIIFSDEEMKASMHAMKSRTWLFEEFYSGVRGSFDEESARGNIHKAFVDDFAKKLAISPSDVWPSIEKHDWNQLVKILLKVVPRLVDTDRYDM